MMVLLSLLALSSGDKVQATEETETSTTDTATSREEQRTDETEISSETKNHEVEKNVKTGEDASSLFNLNSLSRATGFEQNVINGDISATFSGKAGNVLSVSKTPGILTQTAENSLASHTYTQVAWLQKPRSASVSISRGYFDTSLSRVTFSKLNNKGTGWEQNGRVYEGATISSRNISVSFTQLTDIKKTYGEGIYRINIECTNTRGSRVSVAVVVDPETIVPEINFRKEGSWGDSDKHRSDPEEIKIGYYHFLNNGNAKVNQNWTVTNKNSQEKMTGQTQEELTEYFNILAKGDYTIKLDVSTKSQSGQTITGTLTKEFKLTVDYQSMFTIDWEFLNGFIRDNNHYNPNEVQLSCSILNKEVIPENQEIQANLSFVNQSNNQTTNVDIEFLENNPQIFSLPVLKDGAYIARYEVEVHTTNGKVIRKIKEQPIYINTKQPEIIINRELNPCDIFINHVFEQGSKEECDLNIRRYTDSGDLVDHFQTDSLKADVLGELDAEEKTCYFICYRERLGIHPQTGVDVYSERVVRKFDEKHPCPSIEMEDTINPSSIRLIPDKELESVKELTEYDWQIFCKASQSIIKSGEGEVITEEILNDLPQGKYEVTMKEIFKPYYNEIYQQKNGIGITKADFEIVPKELTLDVPSLSFGRHTLGNQSSVNVEEEIMITVKDTLDEVKHWKLTASMGNFVTDTTDNAHQFSPEAVTVKQSDGSWLPFNEMGTIIESNPNGNQRKYEKKWGTDQIQLKVPKDARAQSYTSEIIWTISSVP